MHGFHLAAVFRSGADDINSCRVDTAVAENVGKLGYVFFDAVKDPCEQVAQIVREDLLLIYTGLFT